jgi:excisionase family DNA binding protein
MLAAFDLLPDMLTAKDLEELLQIDRKTIYAYVQRGLIPHVRIESNIRFSKYQVVRWLEEHSFQPLTARRRDNKKSRYDRTG